MKITARKSDPASNGLRLLHVVIYHAFCFGIIFAVLSLKHHDFVRLLLILLLTCVIRAKWLQPPLSKRPFNADERWNWRMGAAFFGLLAAFLAPFASVSALHAMAIGILGWVFAYLTVRECRHILSGPPPTPERDLRQTADPASRR